MKEMLLLIILDIYAVIPLCRAVGDGSVLFLLTQN